MDFGLFLFFQRVFGRSPFLNTHPYAIIYTSTAGGLWSLVGSVGLILSHDVIGVPAAVAGLTPLAPNAQEAAEDDSPGPPRGDVMGGVRES